MTLPSWPAWAISNDESVEREAAPYRALSTDEKLALVKIATRGALLLTQLRPDGLQLWELPVEPLPESTLTALKRLRSTPR